MDTTEKQLEQTVLRRCQTAADLIHTGKYEAAREALKDWWKGVGERPDTEGLSVIVTAELLLRCGALSSFLGTTKQVPQAQEKAKDLLSEALRKFQSQGQHSKVAEVEYELSPCYFRAGAYDDARVILKQALERKPDTELTAKIHIRRAFIEIWMGRYHDAWDILEEVQSFFENCNDALKGRWHGQLGLVLQRLALIEGREDYADRAIIEFTAAIYHYELAGHLRYCAINLNNLAMLLYQMGKYREAHDNLDRAFQVLKGLRDEGLLAQVNETRARVLLAEGRNHDANRLIVEVIEILKQGGEHALLADALIIYATVLSRLKFYEDSIAVFRRALKTAVDSGATSNAAHAALSFIEEHTARLSENEVYKLYLSADRYLEKTQDAEDLGRLKACAKLVAKKLLGPQIGDAKFHLPTVVRSYEARFIEQALEMEGGKISRAAKRLGFNHHGSLASILKRRHKQLASKRSPYIKRRRGIFKSKQQH